MGISHFSKRFILFGNLLLIFLLFNSSGVNSQEKGELKLKSPIISDTTNGTKVSNRKDGGARFDSSSQEKKEKKSENSNEIIEKDYGKSNVSESLLQSNEVDDKKIEKDSSKNVDLKNKDDDNEPRKDDVNEKSNESLMGMEKSKVRDDECDPSNMCVDEKKNLTACLRVPGNDSPDLSLLIRNKGSKPITVTITAPEYVQLEETKVHLEQKEDKKVRVSVAYEVKDSIISLVTEDSRCTLDFKEMIPHDSRIETHYAFKFKIFYNLTKTHCIIYLTLLAFVVFGSIWMCSGLYKKFYPGNGYQTIETELPISGVSKISQDPNDGWDNTWDDHWEDEEAPKTPALPATPNLSSRGLASRRLFKDGWKD